VINSFAETSRIAAGVMIASDLDRTLIYSTSALQLSTIAGELPNLVCVEILHGRPHSFMTLSAHHTLAEIAAVATFVPITTRTVDQYRRIRLPDVTTHYAITSAGGNILVDGIPDDNWYRSTVAAARKSGTSLAEVKHELKSRSAGEWATKHRSGDGLFCYLVVDQHRLPNDFLDSWTSWCTERGWHVSVEGRKIYALPQSLTKERAMLEVAARVSATRIFAAGDGALDAGFLVAATAAIRPPHGQLATAHWKHRNVLVGDHVGVVAADDITSWFADQLVAVRAAHQRVGGPDPLDAAIP
jgi:hypothetical protein